MKLKSLFAILILSCNGLAFSRAQEPAFPAALVRMQDGKDIALADFAKLAADVDFLMLGEEHDSDGAHQMQHDVLKSLVESGVNVAISMEMFERDCQGSLNEYLAGRIDEATFLSTSRPWKNYAEHYRSIIELAKEYKLPVIAANTPRDIASKVSKGESIESTLAPFHARKTTAEKDLYWENFVNAMRGHGGMEESDAGRLFFEAQCLKDDTMAESITDFLASHSHRPVVVVHLCGKFHSDYGLGTVSRIQSRNRLARIMVVSTERLQSRDEFKLKEVQGRAHYMMVVPQNVEKKTEESKQEPKVSTEENKS